MYVVAASASSEEKEKTNPTHKAAVAKIVISRFVIFFICISSINQIINPKTHNCLQKNFLQVVEFWVQVLNLNSHHSLPEAEQVVV